MRHKHLGTKTDKLFFQLGSCKTGMTQGIYQFYIRLLIPDKNAFFHNAGALFLSQRPLILVKFITVGPGYVPSLMEKETAFVFFFLVFPVHLKTFYFHYR